jgi:hypothetical protein
VGFSQTTWKSQILIGAKSLSVPKLWKIRDDFVFGDDFELVTTGETINVSFPQLSSAGTHMKFEGDIAR